MAEVKTNVQVKGSWFENQFKLSQNNTNIKTELIAGFTTFLTMVYIIFVNPSTLSAAGMDAGALFYATIFGSLVGTLCMAFLANYPFALAPGMGLNAFFAYTVCIGMGVSWQIALGLILIEGILFIILSILPIREMIVNCIPMTLKAAISAGIGLFIAFIGMQNAGIIVNKDVVLVGIGDITHGPALIALIGLVFTAILLAYKVKGAFLWGILFSTVIGIFNGVTPHVDLLDIHTYVELPSFSTWAPVLWKFDLGGAINGIFSGGLLAVLISFLFVDMFDTAGTLIGVSTQANYLDEKGNLPKASQALLADAIGTTTGAIFGTSTVTTYVESASGVAVGGRTGLTSFFVACFFALALFFKPLMTIIPAAATAPILILVGVMMMQNVTKIKWGDYTEMIPAFIAMVAMPLTYSISEGIALGFISYPLIKLFTGKGKEVHWLVYVLGVVFLAKYIWL